MAPLILSNLITNGEYQNSTMGQRSKAADVRELYRIDLGDITTDEIDKKDP